MNAVNSVIGYMKHKNTEELGFMKYSYFRKLIKYILDIHREYLIRKLFLKMFDDGYFYKKTLKNKSSYKYKFNPNPKIKIKEEKKDINFIVSWD